MLLDEHTTRGGAPGTARDRHEWHHTSLTPLGEAGAEPTHADGPHTKPENTREYFHSSLEAIADVTSLLAPGDSRR
jgi:hypothetical protein